MTNKHYGFNPRRPFDEHNNDIEHLLFFNLSDDLCIKSLSVYKDFHTACILDPSKITKEYLEERMAFNEKILLKEIAL